MSMRRTLNNLSIRLRGWSHNMRTREVEYSLYWTSLIVIFVTAVAYLLFGWFEKVIGVHGMTRCAFKHLTGHPCPGCGGTRAVIALFHGNISAAIYYHAFAAYGVVLYLLFFASQTLQRLTRGRIKGMKFYMGYVWMALVLLAGQYLLKLCLPGYRI